MLIELPNGDWVNPKSIDGVRMNWDTENHGVVIDACKVPALHLIRFDTPGEAKTWIRTFAIQCNYLEDT